MLFSYRKLYFPLKIFWNCHCRTIWVLSGGGRDGGSLEKVSLSWTPKAEAFIHSFMYLFDHSSFNIFQNLFCDGSGAACWRPLLKRWNLWPKGGHNLAGEKDHVNKIKNQYGNGWESPGLEEKMVRSLSIKEVTSEWRLVRGKDCFLHNGETWRIFSPVSLVHSQN